MGTRAAVSISTPETLSSFIAEAVQAPLVWYHHFGTESDWHSVRPMCRPHKIGSNECLVADGSTGQAISLWNHLLHRKFYGISCQEGDSCNCLGPDWNRHVPKLSSMPSRKALIFLNRLSVSWNVSMNDCQAHACSCRAKIEQRKIQGRHAMRFLLQIRTGYVGKRRLSRMNKCSMFDA